MLARLRSAVCVRRLGQDCNILLIPRVFRPSDVHLYHCVHKETQGYLRTHAHIVASHEDSSPRLDDLLLYNADV